MARVAGRAPSASGRCRRTVSALPRPSVDVACRRRRLVARCASASVVARRLPIHSALRSASSRPSPPASPSARTRSRPSPSGTAPGSTSMPVLDERSPPASPRRGRRPRRDRRRSAPRSMPWRLNASRCSAVKPSTPYAAVTFRKPAHQNVSASISASHRIIVFDARKRLQFKTPRCGPGRYRCSGVPRREVAVIFRPYIPTTLPVLVEDRDHERAVRCSCPLSRSTPSRCSRPRSSAPAFRVLLGSRSPSVRFAKPSLKRSIISDDLQPAALEVRQRLRALLQRLVVVVHHLRRAAPVVRVRAPPAPPASAPSTLFTSFRRRRRQRQSPRAAAPPRAGTTRPPPSSPSRSPSRPPGTRPGSARGSSLGLTTSDGVLSSWKGQRPIRSAPCRFELHAARLRQPLPPRPRSSAAPAPRRAPAPSAARPSPSSLPHRPLAAWVTRAGPDRPEAFWRLPQLETRGFHLPDEQPAATAGHPVKTLRRHPRISLARLPILVHHGIKLKNTTN